MGWGCLGDRALSGDAAGAWGNGVQPRQARSRFPPKIALPAPEQGARAVCGWKRQPRAARQSGF